MIPSRAIRELRLRHLAACLVLILGNGCLRSESQPITEDQIRQLSNARIFNLAMELPGNRTIPLAEDDTKQFLRSLETIREKRDQELAGAKWLATVHLQSGRNPVSFTLYENQSQIVIHVEQRSFALDDEAELRAWMRSQIFYADHADQ